jgi:hypothetical protein
LNTLSSLKRLGSIPIITAVTSIKIINMLPLTVPIYLKFR